MAIYHTMVRSVLRILKQSFDNFFEDDCLRSSAALAFYSAFSLAPLILIAVAIAGTFLGDEAVQGSLESVLKVELGARSAAMIQEMVAHSLQPSDNLMASIFGLVLLLIGAAGFFWQLRAALNRIWNVSSESAVGIRMFLKDYLLSFLMILVSGFLLLISMFLSTASQVLGDRIGQLSGLPIGQWIAGDKVVSFIIAMALFSAIFKILPNTLIQWRNIWAGALFTTCLFMLGKSAIAWYLGKQATASAYGSAGSFIVLLSWLYYSSIIVLFGAEFTKANSRPERLVSPQDGSPLP